MWLRVFCPTTTEVPPAAIAAELLSRGYTLAPHFKGDDLGWTTGELHLANAGTPLGLARFLTKEDKLRPDLDSYAAELETATHSPHAVPLMERVIQTMQLITIRKPIDHPNESLVDRLSEELARWLALQAGGFYQIDQRGWFDAQGELLVEEY